MVRGGIEGGRRVFAGVALVVFFFSSSASAGVLPGPDTVLESRILWVETQMRLSMSRFHRLFTLKNEGADFYSAPVLPAIPLPATPAPVTGTGVSGVTQSAAEGMGEAMSALPQVQTDLASGARVHDLAYKASPEGALRLGADMEGRMFQTLVDIHQDLLYLLKVQSSRSGLKGEILDQSHAANVRDQEILKIDLPQWIMVR